MKLSIENQLDECVCVKVSGEINVSVPGEQNHLLDLLGENLYSQRICFNLADATFINSTGLSWLVILYKRFRESQGRMVVHSVPELIMDVLQTVKFDTILPIADDESAAMALLQN